jgi:hypothetical protein
MANLFFGFKDLVNSYPSGKSVFDLSSFLISDKQLKSISPKRYNFYIKFVNGLADPEVLEKFFYKTKEAKVFKQDLNEKIAKFADIIAKLNRNSSAEDARKIKENIANTIKERYNLSDDVASKLNNMMSGGNKVLNKGQQPMQNFINVVSNELPEVASKSIRSFKDLLIENPSSTEGKDRSVIVKKAEEIYNAYKDDISPDRMQINMTDRIVFIVVTLLIRFTALIIIKWGLDTNLINSFFSAFNYYCFIYLLIFIFITMFVNVIIAYPVVDLFSNSSIIDIPNIFYYFYIYANGSIRLIIHMIFIIGIMFIPYIISVDKFNLRTKNESVNISTDEEKKKKIYDMISLFSIIIWILTSLVAFKF